MNSFQKELSRPPIYNPEDYAISLKKWINKPVGNGNEQYDATPSCAEREMSLRQFSNISDLLNKLKTDLRLAYISFVQEFVADPTDGITLLLELLRTIQSNDTNQHTKVASALHRRALLDENSCLQCLRYSLRCPETTRRLAMASTGLFSLTVCIMSSVSKSRIIALELLTKICCYSIAGHNAVSEAMSTMRLRFGEPVRFRFLVSMLNGAASDLLTSGLRFINTFLETSPKKQNQFYIQAELEQAGFNTSALKDMMSSKDAENEAIIEELNRWSKLYIDVETLKNNYSNKCKEISVLKEKILDLESQLRTLQNEKQSLISNGSCFNDRPKLNNSNSDSRSNSCIFKTHINFPKQGGENSTPAEDEGISSSDQDDSEENVNQVCNDFNLYKVYHRVQNKSFPKYHNCEKNSTEPTIEEVMEDFQNVINDVKKLNLRNNRSSKSPLNRNASYESVGLISEEMDIIPSKILPEPPKKSRSLYFLNENIEKNPFFEDESPENSNCSCSSQGCSISDSENEYSKVEYVCKNKLRKSEKSNQKINGLRRSETFHHLQNKKESSTPSPMHKKGGSSDCHNGKSYENKTKIMNMKNKNYIIQNSSNFEKEMMNRNSNVKTTTKLLRSASTKPIINNLKLMNVTTSFPTNVKLNPSIHFLNKANVFSTNTSHFTLKRRNNAGLYSGKNHIQNSNPSYNSVTTITSNFPKKCANSSKNYNYNGFEGKIMDLPSGLY